MGAFPVPSTWGAPGRVVPRWVPGHERRDPEVSDGQLDERLGTTGVRG